MTIRIGAGPIGWFEDDFSAFRNDIAREAQLISVARAGFDGICLNPGSAREVACVHAAIARHGLAFIAPTHTISLVRKHTAEQAFAELQPHVRAARALGAAELSVCEASSVVMSEADWQRFGDRLTDLATAFTDSGVRLVYRPRAGTIVTSTDDLNALMTVTSAKVGLMLDAGVFGNQTADVARRHAGRVAMIAPGSASGAMIAALPNFRGWAVLDQAAGQAPVRVERLQAIAA